MRAVDAEVVLAAYLLGGPSATAVYGVHLPEPAALDSMIQEAMGEASMCWANVERAGLFDPARAIAVGHRLRTRILIDVIWAQLNRDPP